MKKLGGTLVAEALADAGIRHTFGIPGTHNIELYDALAEADGVMPVLVTDEQSAGFMADGYWRASGRLACLNLVPGAGLTHALSGIAEAYMDDVPMLVLGCGIRRDLDRAFQLHDVDQSAIVAPVTKAQLRVEDGAHLYGTVREAVQLASSGAPGPVFVEVPANLYLLRQEVPVGYRSWSPGVLGPESSLATRPFAAEEIAALLASASRVLIYAGAGAAAASDELVRLAETLEAPVSTTFQGKGVFPESHPLSLWPGFGRSAPPFARQIAAEADVTLAIGCKFGEVATGSYGMAPPGRLIHVDVNPAVTGRNYPAHRAVHRDAGTFLRAVNAALDGLGKAPKPDGSLRRRIRERRAAVRDGLLEPSDPDLVNPTGLLVALQAVLGPDAVYATDSGNGTFLAMEGLVLDKPGKFMAPVDYSCMGYSVPAAIGAKLAAPEHPVVALAGDGAFLMTGLELLTAVREGLGVLVFVLRDRELAQIGQFQQTAFGRKVASEVADYDVEGLAAGLGVAFLRLDSDSEVEDVVRKAAVHGAAGRPVLVDVAIDYSRKTFFTGGIVKSNLLRLPLREQIRFVGRALSRKLD